MANNETTETRSEALEKWLNETNDEGLELILQPLIEALEEEQAEVKAARKIGKSQKKSPTKSKLPETPLDPVLEKLEQKISKAAQKMDTAVSSLKKDVQKTQTLFENAKNERTTHAAKKAEWEEARIAADAYRLEQEKQAAKKLRAARKKAMELFREANSES